MRTAFRLLTCASLLAFASASLADSADARERGRHGGRGPGAHPARRAPSGSVHGEVTRTGPGGQSRTWQRDDTWQRGDGRFEGHRTVTGPNGDTRQRDGVAQRTDTGHTRSTTWTGRQGDVTTRDATLVKDPDAGTRTKDVIWTGPEGRTRTRHTEIQRGDAVSE